MKRRLAHILVEPLFELGWTKHPDLQDITARDFIAQIDEKLEEDEQNAVNSGELLSKPLIREIVVPTSYSAPDEYSGAKRAKTRRAMAKWYGKTLIDIETGGGFVAINAHLPGQIIVTNDEIVLPSILPQALRESYRARLNNKDNPLLMRDIIDFAEPCAHGEILAIAEKKVNEIRTTNFRFRTRWLPWDDVKNRLLERHG